MAATKNDSFALPDGSFSKSVIQDYTEYIIKEQETFHTNPCIYIHINRINDRLVFKIKY